jgi:hypothetical protein
VGAEAVRWASVARCLPTVGSHSETSLPVSDTTQGVPSVSLAWASACVGSPVVVPDSVALGQLSKPLGAQLSNPWTVTGSGRLFLSWVQEEPPSLRTEREGGQGSSRLFCPSPSRPFRSDGGCLPSPLVCEPEPLGLGKVAGGAPESLARSERAVRGPPGFWFAPRA